MFCPICGAPGAEDARFCERCGSPVDAEPVADPEYYDANVYAWKYGYEYAPYAVREPIFQTYLLRNIAMLIACSPILGTIGVFASTQAARFMKFGYVDLARSRARFAELIFWVGMAVGIVWSLVLSISKWDELLQVAIDSYSI